MELEELREYIINIEERAFKLTKEQLSRIIYYFTENRHILHRCNTTKKETGRHTIEWFKSKNNFSLCKPEWTPKGKGRKIKLSSAERVTNVNAVCVMNASTSLHT